MLALDIKSKLLDTDTVLRTSLFYWFQMSSLVCCNHQVVFSSHRLSTWMSCVLCC